jgi:hypothetical protein
VPVSVFDRPLLKRALLPVTSFVLICVVGIAGFVYLEGVSVIEAAFWLLDPTSIELHGVDNDVRAFSLIVIVGLILSVIWIGETVFGAVFGGQLKEEFERMNTKRQIDEMTDHVIICGYGSFGRTIARTLSNADRDVIIIERDQHRFETIANDELLAVNGDARMEGALQEAGIERADDVVIPEIKSGQDVSQSIA